MNPVSRLVILALFACALWIVHAVNWVSGNALTLAFGLMPRRVDGLDGIVFMPLLHGSFGHVASNTVPLLVMGTLLVVTATRALTRVNGVIVLGGGTATWLFGSSAIHVGASGLVFGWFGFLIARGVVDRSPITVVVALLIGFVYGALIWGVLPGRPGVSWEAHFFGVLAGIAAAWIVPSGVRRPSLRARG